MIDFIWIMISSVDLTRYRVSRAEDLSIWGLRYNYIMMNQWPALYNTELQALYVKGFQPSSVGELLPLLNQRSRFEFRWKRNLFEP